MNIKHLLLFAGLAAGLTSCDHLLEFEPGDVILAEDAIQDAEDLQRLLVSNYDVVANLYGGRVQIVNELRGPNFGNPTTAWISRLFTTGRPRSSPASMAAFTPISTTRFTDRMWSSRISTS